MTKKNVIDLSVLLARAESERQHTKRTICIFSSLIVIAFVVLCFWPVSASADCSLSADGDLSVLTKEVFFYDNYSADSVRYRYRAGVEPRFDSLSLEGVSVDCSASASGPFWMVAMQ
ncbi:hypothetical protein GOV10_00135 [Candidatus Woesearchaeota archaeon]|nr:hypothetical protein [Candidatus Woesearchaeota archaeon]